MCPGPAIITQFSRRIDWRRTARECAEQSLRRTVIFTTDFVVKSESQAGSSMKDEEAASSFSLSASSNGSLAVWDAQLTPFGTEGVGPCIFIS